MPFLSEIPLSFHPKCEDVLKWRFVCLQNHEGLQFVEWYMAQTRNLRFICSTVGALICSVPTLEMTFSYIVKEVYFSCLIIGRLSTGSVVELVGLRLFHLRSRLFARLYALVTCGIIPHKFNAAILGGFSVHMIKHLIITRFHCYQAYEIS